MDKCAHHSKKNRESRVQSAGSPDIIYRGRQRARCSPDLAPLTTNLRPRNSLSCNSSTARFASSTVCICTKRNLLSVGYGGSLRLPHFEHVRRR